VSIRALKADLASAGLAPNKKLGQNFMVDHHAIADLVAAAQLPAASQVVEIGPGTGLLTQELLDQGHHVLAVELDRGLAEFLRQRYAGLEKFRLIEGDCLANKNTLNEELVQELGESPWHLVANLPYEPSLPLLLNAVAESNPPLKIAVTVQLEAAQRLCARRGDTNWGAATAVFSAACSHRRIIRQLGPQSFFPPPRVHSAILQATPERKLPDGFTRFCRTIFSYRRKVIRRALRDARWPIEDLAALGIDPERRVQELSVEELLKLSNAKIVGDES
jgi:16S rRNA (adenine1518-N6/adenine1519-N6)-dimethyltransferase